MSKRLRSISVTVEDMNNIIVRVERNGEVCEHHLIYCMALRSYYSIVTLFDGDQLYLVPRYDYSTTTWKHVNSFIHSGLQNCIDLTASDIRKAVKDNYSASLIEDAIFDIDESNNFVVSSRNLWKKY